MSLIGKVLNQDSIEMVFNSVALVKWYLSEHWNGIQANIEITSQY